MTDPRAGELRRQAWAAAQAGRMDAALQAIETACRLAPGVGALHADHGRLLAAAGRPGPALEAFHRATTLAPGDAAGWHFLGLALGQQGRLAEAIPALRRAHALAPAEARTLSLLASAVFEAGDPAEALPLFEALHQRQPADVPVLLRLGEVHNRLGDAGTACRVYREALDGQPGSAELWLALAQSEEIAGQRGHADAAYGRALALRPGWPAALAGRLALQRGRAGDALLAAADALLADPSLPDAERAQVGYELGKARDARGEYGAALAAWDQANAARRREAGEPDLAALERRVEASMARFDGALLSRAAALGNPDPRPVFVVGLPRSGTTLLEQMLAAHPAVHGAGELPDLAMIARDLPVRRGDSARWPHLLEDFDPAWVAPAAARYLAALTRGAPPDARRIVDKFPYNSHLLGFAALLFPNARVLWCRRDPRDVAVSIYGENFAPAERLATDFAGIGHLARLERRLMRHWQAVLPIPVHAVHYESLVRSPESEARRAVAACGLDWDPACLAFHENTSAVQTPSRWQVRQPVHTRSIGRWKHYASRMDALLAALGEDPLPAEP